MFKSDAFKVWAKVPAKVSPQRARFSAISLRAVLSFVLVLSICIGPYAFAFEMHAQEHQGHHHHSQSSTDPHTDPAEDEHSGVGHALVHCGTGYCAPTFVGFAYNATTVATLTTALSLRFGDDAELPALYLDADPPVPRV
tara:strand:- start:758 stop:1177 length:420 start_codon:yes stop_codon:yes gene_type:complete